jgi:hypothetical protein
VNRDHKIIISGFSSLIISGLLLIFVFLPPDEPFIPIQPIGEQIVDDDNEGEERQLLEQANSTVVDGVLILDNVTVTILNGTSGDGQQQTTGGTSGTNSNGGGGSGGGGGRGSPGDTTPPTVTGEFSRTPDIATNTYTHPVTVTWIGQDNVGGSGIDFCDLPTNYSGPDGSAIELVGHCTDEAGNVGTGHVTFNYNSSLFALSILSYNLTISSNVINVSSSISANAATNDTSITNIVFVWIDPSNTTESSTNKTVTLGSAVDIFTAPNKTGVWKVDAHFKNATQNDVAVVSRSFNVTSGDGQGGGGNGNGGSGGSGNGGTNQPPVAANDLVTTSQNVPIVVDVLANDFDADGDSLALSVLTQPSNGTAIANENGTVTYTPMVNFKGVDAFTYKNSDGALQSNFANVTILVTTTGNGEGGGGNGGGGEEGPTANAGPDQVVDEETLVTLNGSASADVSFVVWAQISGGTAVTLINANTLTPSFMAPSISHAGPLSMQLTFLLTVANDHGVIRSDSVVVTVNDVNKPPVANAGPDQSVNESGMVVLTGTGSDPDSDPLTFSWHQIAGPSVLLVNTTSASPSFTSPQVANVTVLTFELAVSDGFGGNSTDSVSITVINTDDGNQIGDEGCSPGFWKQHTAATIWGPTGYSSNDLVGGVFQGMFGVLADDTLEQALHYEGGPGLDGAERILLRAAVAALLNSAHPDIDYPSTSNQVIAKVNEALESDNRVVILDLAEKLDANNDLGCSIDANGDDSGDREESNNGDNEQKNERGRNDSSQSGNSNGGSQDKSEKQERENEKDPGNDNSDSDDKSARESDKEKQSSSSTNNGSGQKNSDNDDKGSSSSGGGKADKTSDIQGSKSGKNKG